MHIRFTQLTTIVQYSLAYRTSLFYILLLLLFLFLNYSTYPSHNTINHVLLSFTLLLTYCKTLTHSLPIFLYFCLPFHPFTVCLPPRCSLCLHCATSINSKHSNLEQNIHFPIILLSHYTKNTQSPPSSSIILHHPPSPSNSPAAIST